MMTMMADMHRRMAQMYDMMDGAGAVQVSAGDFSDPLSLHGTDMPGVKELSVGAAQVNVEYSALPNGAQIVFTTEGIHLVTALHRWFGAQLSDHGADATYR
jgi:hypothetical protein